MRYNTNSEQYYKCIAQIGYIKKQKTTLTLDLSKKVV